jgi:hypothetical protein
LEVFDQFKAEVDGAELAPEKRLQLQKKYGIVPVTEEDHEAYLSLQGTARADLGIGGVQ